MIFGETPYNDPESNIDSYRYGPWYWASGYGLDGEKQCLPSLKFDGEIGCRGYDPTLYFNGLEASIGSGDNVYLINGEGQGYDYDGDVLTFKLDGTYRQSDSLGDH